MSGYLTGETADLFDPITGAFIGHVDLAGRETVVPVIDLVRGLVDPRTQSSVSGGGGATKLDRAISRYKGKFVAGQSKLTIAGDSFAYGIGASTQSNSYYGLLAAEFNQYQCANYGWSGYPVQKYATAPIAYGVGAGTGINACQLQMLSGDITCSIIDLNGLRGVGQAGGVSTTGCGPNPDNYASLRSKVIAMATHFMIPEANKVRIRNQAQTALNPALTFTGSWTQILNGQNGSAYTQSVGGSVSGTTAVGNLLIIRCMQDSAAVSTWNLTIDGVSYPPLYAKSSYDVWSEDSFVIRLPNVAAHTFTLSHPNSDGNALVLISIDCVDTTKDFGATFLYSTPGYMADGPNIGWGLTGYTANSASANSATGALAWNYGNGAADRYGIAIDQAMDFLFDLGFNVVKCDHRIGWKTAAFVGADTVHPGDSGYSFIYNNFAGPIRLLYAAR